jgi:hypothetical protein
MLQMQAGAKRGYMTIAIVPSSNTPCCHTVAQDRLYIRGADDPSRRACQTVMAALLRGMLAAVAPIAPHMAEDAWQHRPAAFCAAGSPESVFQTGWPATDPDWRSLPQGALPASAAWRLVPCSSSLCLLGWPHMAEGAW